MNTQYITTEKTMHKPEASITLQDHIRSTEKMLGLIDDDLQLIEDKIVAKHGYTIKCNHKEIITNEEFPEMNGIATKIMDIVDRIDTIHSVLIDKEFVDKELDGKESTLSV